MAARVIVIGTGPAGVRAAEALVEAGLRPTVIDEGRRDGGQIYRRQPEGFTRSYDTLYGTESARAAALHQSFDALKSRIDYLPETLVWNISANAVHLVSGTSCRTLEFDTLIVCSGATDRLMPVKGWHYARRHQRLSRAHASRSRADNHDPMHAVFIDNRAHAPIAPAGRVSTRMPSLTKVEHALILVPSSSCTQQS